jgi:peptide subunit release factor 1 (eRF1)
VLTLSIARGPADDTIDAFRERYEQAVADARRRRPAELDAGALDAAEARARAVVWAIEEAPRETLRYPRPALWLTAEPGGTARTAVVAQPIALPLPTLGRFARRRFLAPLLLAEAAEPVGLAVLVDDAHAVFITIEGEHADGTERISDPLLPRHSKGGWRQARIQRHRDRQIEEHLDHVATEITRLLRANASWRLAIGGHDAVRSALERRLAPAVMERHAGDFHGQLHQPAHELADLARPVLVAAGQRDDASELEAVADHAAKGGRGAVGWGPVLQALAEGAVRDLLCAREPVPLPASRDAGGALSAVAVGEPSWSSGEPTLAAAELPYDAVHDAVLQGASLRALEGDAAARLAELGGVAASLRHG